ncbi:MAG: MBL fold metallo-hydrolase [Deltaproteobacteria bacterium]|nr:MBL fold metallo-hydrolase [Deltaproteobacteria bacterium]MBW2075772.1 MBL fold metallo-hydrolase [Deltaproteobacteria bacterium]RLB81267.1 MAG: MBL fold metallo-hydrolase [Deltaproteobacteria bacterium]
MIIKQMKVGPMDVFCYILGCEDTHKGLVIDPAGEEERILETALGWGLTIESVVNTHGHPDHTCGNRKIAEQTQAKIYMHALDDRFFNTPQGQSMAMQMGFTPSPPADVLLEDGDTVPFGYKELTVLHTPGHSPGGICLHVENNLFTGDTLFVGAVGRTDLPGGSLETLLGSIKNKILSLPDDTIIWPGHDYGRRPTSTIALEKTHNPYITDFQLI